MSGGPNEHDERDRLNRAGRERYAATRDIGKIPPVKNRPRRNRCRDSLREFCEVYFRRRFYLAWSPAHLKAIDRLERCIRDGGQFCLAMPRGSGKSSLVEVAALWGILYGHRKFAVVLAANERLAGEILAKLKAELEGNPLLLEDFPEAAFPIAKLEGISHRTRGQTSNGKRTQIGWTAEAIVFPTVPGNRGQCAGSVIRVVGITGAIRGAARLGPDGRPLRPDLVLLDDVQTREVAKSPTQVADRLAVIEGDVLALAGPDQRIAAVATVTVIYDGDLASQLLDREKSPHWQGERTALLTSWPANRELWDEYARIQADELRAGGDGSQATAFYVANREAMDAGAETSWPERVRPGEVSAIQGAMNLFFRSPRAFSSEYQNQPLRDTPDAAVRELDAEEVARRLTNVPRGQVPREATRLVAFIDCGDRCLFYGVLAVDDRFSGSLIDHGVFPPQNRPYFDAADARPALADVFPGHTEPQRLYAGLKALTALVLGREYPRHGSGSGVKVERCLIDAGWQADAVHQFARESVYAPLLYPSKGYATTSNARPMNEWAHKPGERRGWNWRLTSVAGVNRGRLVLFDPDAWKGFLADRLTTPPGGAGAVMLYGDRADAHALFAAHLTAEYATPAEVRGRRFHKWTQRPDRRDNHFLDVATGLCVAASVQGLAWSEAPGAEPALPRGPRKKLTYRDQKAKLGMRSAAGGGAWRPGQ